MTRRDVSLDATAADGRSYHELVADPASIELPAELPSKTPSESPTDDAADAARGAVALMDAAERVRELERRATTAESDALVLRHQANRETARAIALANALTQAIELEDLATLSPQQLAIVRTRIAIVDEGDVPTHHEVSRRLGLHPAAVSRQWSRVLGKLAAHRGRDVSTSAA